jgi:hypothetical protein
VAAVNAAAPQNIQLAAAPPASSAVVPAAYLAAASSVQPAPVVPQAASTTALAGGPWRTPQVPQANPTTMAQAPLMTPATVGATVPSNSMDVRLRAVPSPPPEPVQPTTPRIRLPGYTAPQVNSGASAFAQPAAPYAGMNPTSPVLQTVQMSPMQSPPELVATSLAAPPVAIASGDGFRPRTSRH